MMRVWVLAGFAALMAGAAWAHASEQGFVLLLPTDAYIAAGVLAVALTVGALAIAPRVGERLFVPLRLPLSGMRAKWPGPLIGSCVAALGLFALVFAGLYGARDPMENPLPLFVWTLWWVGLVSVQGLVFDHWRWSNPWTGPGAVLAWITGARAPLRYPRRLGYWPGIVGFLAFAGFLLADPAPSDPARLALIVGIYWLVMAMGLALFGARWLLCADAVTILMRSYGRMAMVGRARGRVALGLPGWQVMAGRRAAPGLGIFILLMLGSGSFDGLNETFWWLVQIGINPLEFPGRSAVMVQTLTGLLVANAALIAVFFAATRIGLWMAGSDIALSEAVRLFAPAILPIALGYHIAHYLTSFLVDGQYVLVALSDPLHRGADLLGLGPHFVTTGFLHTPATVRMIWLSQAGAVVGGHVIAILMAHALSLRQFPEPRRALLSQAPLAAFMIAYTFFGLWLLASPRGM